MASIASVRGSQVAACYQVDGDVGDASCMRVKLKGKITIMEGVSAGAGAWQA